MKLFSRKALVAGATAVAVAFAGTSVATAQENNGSSDSISQLSSGENAGEGLSSDLPALASLSSNDDDKKPEDGDLSSKPDEIASWISVFTAIVGALAAAFSFATKYLGFKF